MHGATPAPSFEVLPEKEWYSRVGKRTDIYYHNAVVPKWLIKQVKEFKEAGGKFWCCANPWIVLRYINVSQTLDPLIDYRYPSLELFFAVHRVLGCNPAPGTLVLADILRYNVSNVFIGGMTCWIEDMTSPGRQDSTHNSWQDFKWIYKLSHDNDKIKVDKTLEALFIEYRDNIKDC